MDKLFQPVPQVLILISVKKGDKIIAQNAFFPKRIAPFYLLFNGILV
jgi:hypothetical protein